MVGQPEKDNLYLSLEAVIADVSSSPSYLADFLVSVRRRYQNIIERCAVLQKTILEDNLSDEVFFGLKSEYFQIKMDLKRINTLLKTIPTVVAIASMVLVVSLVVIQFEVRTFLVERLGIGVPVKIILLALFGVALYFLTTRLSTLDGNNSVINGIQDIAIRVCLSLIVSAVLIMLFFDASGALQEKIEVTPELLSFACGYSAKLVMDLLNKLVEKAGKVIQAI